MTTSVGKVPRRGLDWPEFGWTRTCSKSLTNSACDWQTDQSYMAGGCRGAFLQKGRREALTCDKISVHTHCFFLGNCHVCWPIYASHSTFLHHMLGCYTNMLVFFKVWHGIILFSLNFNLCINKIISVKHQQILARIWTWRFANTYIKAKVRCKMSRCVVVWLLEELSLGKRAIGRKESVWAKSQGKHDGQFLTLILD